MTTTIFQQTTWWIVRYDGRRSLFRGVSREQFAEAKKKHYSRVNITPTLINKVEQFKYIKRLFARIPYELPAGSPNDYSKYQRPSSNGIGYVAICPSEKGNNIYVDEPCIVKYLTRKYNEWKNGRM